MKPVEVFTGNWGIIENGVLIVSGLRTNADAWRWIDRQIGDPISRSEKVSEFVWDRMVQS